MRKMKQRLFMLVALAIAFGLHRNSGSLPQPMPSPAASTNLPCAAYKEHRKQVSESPIIPTLQEKTVTAYKVLEVIDGDTLTVAKAGETKVRLMGMDTPERTTTRNGKVEHYGEEAFRYAKSLIDQSGGEVYFTYDQVKQDQYGRDLAYVWLKDGRLLNAVMVADGYAYSYSSSPKPQYVDLFLVLMRQARKQGKGLWGACQ